VLGAIAASCMVLAGSACASDPTAAPAAGGVTAPAPAPLARTGTTAPADVVGPHAEPTAPPAPVVARTGPSRPVAAPVSTPIANIRRDCGMTAPLSNGRTLWIYCDTALFGTDQRLQHFVNTSAAVASPDAPTVMQDAVDVAGLPLTFLQSGADYPVCDGAEKRSLWPQSAVTLPAGPDQAEDRVLIWYSNVCLVPGGAETFDIGLAEARYAVGAGASSTPTSVTIRAPRLFPKLGKAGGYGVASVLDGPDAYVYWCGQDTDPCTVARVPWDAAADAAAYRYWDGRSWVPDAAAAKHLVMGPSQARIKASVRWVAGLDRYVMVDVDAWSTLTVRVATRPEGPWTEPAWVRLGECTQVYPNNCFAAEVQPQLSGPDHVAVSYFDPTRPFGLEPTTRVVDVPITIAR
jgi:hypothetical protein